jgi:hypothetical protein
MEDRGIQTTESHIGFVWAGIWPRTAVIGPHAVFSFAKPR